MSRHLRRALATERACAQLVADTGEYCAQAAKAMDDALASHRASVTACEALEQKAGQVYGPIAMAIRNSGITTDLACLIATAAQQLVTTATTAYSQEDTGGALM